MKNKGFLNIVTDKKNISVPFLSILYVQMEGNNAFIHTKNQIYQTRMTLSEIEPVLGDDFLKVKRGCLVSVIAIHNIGERINLINGETLEYATRHRKEIVTAFREKQELIVRELRESVHLVSQEEYHDHYRLFDSLPIAFCDIEMVFDEEDKAVDWIFRYANKALADLEKVPLEKLLGNSFSGLFPNMDTKWLRSYERATLFHETVKIIDYSPEIDTYLDIICFPTFRGHCGCILFDISKINSYRQATDPEKALVLFLSKMLTNDEVKK